MKIKRSYLCWLLVFLLTLFSAFSALASTIGDSMLLGDGLMPVPEEPVKEVDEEPDLETYVEMDDVSLLSVNDDLSGAYKLPIHYVQSDLLAPSRQLGNKINNIQGLSDIRFHFTPFGINNDGYFSQLDYEYVLTFENGYDPNKIGVISSTSGITGTKGFQIAPFSGSSSTPTGFQYVDDNTIRISYQIKVDDGSISFVPNLLLRSADYLLGNSVKCELYAIRKSSSVTMEGGDGGGGSDSGGAST